MSYFSHSTEIKSPSAETLEKWREYQEYLKAEILAGLGVMWDVEHPDEISLAE